MAVYTEVADEPLKRFLEQYDIGQPVSCKGIAEGVENSNFLLVTERGTFILTLYEKRVAAADLPFFLGLMEHLAARGVPCPLPVQGRDGQALRRLAERPAAIATFLPGLWPRQVRLEHCAPLGAAMAALHRAGEGFALTRANALGPAGWPPLAAASRDRADTVQPGLAAAIDAALADLARDWPRDLPRGVIHADLFPDNVFFQDGRLSGLIDFYFACDDLLAYDLAVTLNAWCFEADGTFHAARARALVAGYESVRPLQPAERAALPVLARGAALRFLLTRLYDWLNPAPGALVKPKDPLEYARRLAFHQGVAGPEDYGLAA